jgi:hypothetical protein
MRNSYDEGMQELFSLASKKGLLESEKDPATLKDNAEYQQLSERVSELRSELDETLASFDDEHDISAMYRDLGDAFAFDDEDTHNEP